MKNYIIIFLIVVSSVFYFLYSQEKEKKQDIIFADTPLPQGVSAQIVNKPDKTQIKVSSGTGVAVQSIPNYPESSITVNIQDNGGYEVKQKIYGPCIKPALTLGYSENLNIGIVTRLFFYRDFGASAGLIYDIIDKNIAIVACADYRLRALTVPNLSVFVGYSSDSRVVAGFNLYL